MRGALLYSITIVRIDGVINLPVIWALVCMIIGLAFLFMKVESRVPDHILNVRLFKNRVFSGSCLATFMNYTLSYSISFFVVLYLQSIGNLTSTEAGLLMLVHPAVQAVLTPYFGSKSNRVGDKRLLSIASLLISAVGLFQVFLFNVDTSPPRSRPH